MIGAIVLLALGITDWLTTSGILKNGGYERNPAALWMMDRLGVNPFLIGKALLMGVLGFLAPWWLWAPLAAFYAPFMFKNVMVLGKLRKQAANL